MNETRLRQLLREAPIPEAVTAERRGLALVEAALAERDESGSARGRPGARAAVLRPALVLSLAAVLVALVLSPAGAAVREWVGDVLTTTETPRPERGLAEIPGGGSLLVQSAAGPWVVRSDGSRRLLGDYGEASWSPRGLFLAVASGRELSAVEPDGTPRWTLTAPGRVADVRWSPHRYRIAYRSGETLRVTAADGSADRLIAAVISPVAPAWDPRHRHLLAFVGARGELRIGDSEDAGSRSFGPALPETTAIDWAGARLLEASPRQLRLRRVSSSGAAADAGPRQVAMMLPDLRLRLPSGARVLSAALSPDGETVAASVSLAPGLTATADDPEESGDASSVGAPARDAVYLFDARDGSRRRLLAVPDPLTQLVFSPDSERLLIGWPRLDQWLFLPVRPGVEGRSLVGISAAFAPGRRAAAFPRVEGWCCAGAR